MKNKSLIQKVKSGDRKAFDVFCAELYPNLISYARMFLSEEWAEDVVQDVFFAVWQKRESLDENQTVSGYLFRSVRNCSINYLKSQEHSKNFREWNQNRIAALGLQGADIDSNPVIRKLYDGDLRQRLAEAIASLPSRQREIFNLSYVEELSNKEIGERLGISTRTVESHIYEALKNLRQKLSPEDYHFLITFFLYSSIFTILN